MHNFAKQNQHEDFIFFNWLIKKNQHLLIICPLFVFNNMYCILIGKSKNIHTQLSIKEVLVDSFPNRYSYGKFSGLQLDLLEWLWFNTCLHCAQTYAQLETKTDTRSTNTHSLPLITILVLISYFYIICENTWLFQF